MATMAVALQQTVKIIIGIGSFISSTRKLRAAKSLPEKLQKPRAVAANRVGKKYWFAAKLSAKQIVTPNFASMKNAKKYADS